jgi:hypothetical protein
MRLTSLWFGEAPSCDDLATARNCDLGLQYFTLDPYVNRAYSQRLICLLCVAFFGFAGLAEVTALKNQAEDNHSLGEKYEF